MTAPIRIPPQNLEAEREILGTAIQMPRSLPLILSELSGDEFYRPQHKSIFEAIKTLYAAGQNVDLVTIVDQLRRADEVDYCGGPAYIAGLANEIPSILRVSSHCRIVKERAAARDLITLAAEMAEECYSCNDIKDIVDGFGKRFFDIAAEKNKSARAISEIFPGLLEQMKKRCESGSGMSGASCGFPDIDRILSGLSDSDLIIIAGRPSMGKTTLAMNMAQSMAFDGKTVLVFSLEMDDRKLVERLISSDSGVNLKSIRDGLLNDTTWPMVMRSVSRFSQKKLIIDESSGLSITQVRARAKMQKSKTGLDVIFVDYLQLMRGTGGNREQEIADIARGLKGLAKELNIPVVALSQLSRKCDERSDKRPVMSDLRESGSIEQDADIVAFVYRDEIYNTSPDNPMRGMAEFIVRKNRSGETGTVELYFRGECTLFQNKANPYTEEV